MEHNYLYIFCLKIHCNYYTLESLQFRPPENFWLMCLDSLYYGGSRHSKKVLFCKIICYPPITIMFSGLYPKRLIANCITASAALHSCSGNGDPEFKIALKVCSYIILSLLTANFTCRTCHSLFFLYHATTTPILPLNSCLRDFFLQ